MNLKDNLQLVKNDLPKGVCLVAVSKTKSVSDILEVYNAGQRIFGENKIQEMSQKQKELPKDIEWHMIGHLQRNKIKYMASFVNLIHGVDSFKILKEINKQAIKHNRIINCLLQAKIATEKTKFGLSFCEIENVLNSAELRNLNNINIIGFMGMASFTTNQEQIKIEFRKLNDFFNIQKNNVQSNIHLQIVSIGMSGDYQIAIQNGSTMVRVGSAIFGKRIVSN